MRTIGITGASGYIGSVLVREFEVRGWSVVALQRRPPQNASLPWRYYSLESPFADDLLAGLDVLVHCAYDRSSKNSSASSLKNVSGTRCLLEAAAAAVPRTILVSSMSARLGTVQTYGREKLAAEQDAFRIDSGIAVVRPGIVYGPNAGGIVGALHRLTRLPVVPLIASRARHFTVHESDLAAAIASLADIPVIPASPIALAHASANEFRVILRVLAQETGRAPRFVPVPWRAAYYPMRLAEAIGVPLPLRSDSILGLLGDRVDSSAFATAEALQLRFRPLIDPGRPA